jgi:hypothetical protein
MEGIADREAESGSSVRIHFRSHPSFAEFLPGTWPLKLDIAEKARRGDQIVDFWTVCRSHGRRRIGHVRPNST